MPSTLSNRERAHLKAKAHVLEPVVHVGTAGLTDGVVAEAEKALAAHELIKVKVAGDDRAVRVAMGDELCARTGAAVVHRVGKIVILWRARPEIEAAAKRLATSPPAQSTKTRSRD